MGCRRSGWTVQGDAASNHTTLSRHLRKLGYLRMQKLTKDEPIHLLMGGTGVVNSSQLREESEVVLSCETIRHRCQKFGPRYAQNLRQRKGRLGDIRHLD